MAMLETELRFKKMKRNGILTDPFEFHQPMSGISQKALDPVAGMPGSKAKTFVEECP